MFLPDNIDFTESKTYILSIRLTPSGFYFSVHSPSNEKVFYQNNVQFGTNSDYLKNIEKLIFDYSFFTYNYRQINVICVDDKTTIVPNEFHEKKLESDFLSYNCLNPRLQVIINEISELDCKVVWSMDTSVHSFLSRTLLNPNFVNHLSLLVPYFYKLHDNSTSALFVNFNDDKLIDTIAFREKKLILAKTFHANNQLEENYYIQKTWEALQLDVQADILYFSGKISNHSECIETLKKVVSKTRNLSFELPRNMQINHEEIPIEILNQLCES